MLVEIILKILELLVIISEVKMNFPIKRLPIHKMSSSDLEISFNALGVLHLSYF